mmetsp:Transcript_40886/g.97871  ORF Transcript_40886/g.97871 Transcript_40886/m.97871 type:complete len:720 (+) Transcript_40886:258-2417(+)
MSSSSRSQSSFSSSSSCDKIKKKTEIDVVWLKKDVRLHDHGPIHDVCFNTSALLPPSPLQQRPFILLYLFEPDQLQQKTVHGSHVRFAYEGLIDLEQKFQQQEEELDEPQQHEQQRHEQRQYVTVCHNTAVETLNHIQNHPSSKYKIARLLAHEETGHWQSYTRDRQVRTFCKEHSIPFMEYNQTGVTRCLKNRDDFSKNFHACITAPQEYPTPNIDEMLLRRIIHIDDLPGTILFQDHRRETKDTSSTTTTTTSTTNNISNRTRYQLDLSIFHQEIPVDHRCDRPQRQQEGGETKALATLDSFLQERGSKFSQDISSPNTSWNSCSRLSPYLTFGHISLRHVMKTLQRRQDDVRRRKSQGRNTGTWIRSLAAFSSRLHWRSHFIQKLESEPRCEFQDFCPSFQHVRRQDGDYNEAYYQAWVSGTTGFPFVDACQRCLHQHGWINFRMRAMLVSFATYNLWLDWTRISSHLGRVFLDYEPGIHYPQIQMQAGTTGINAMRVYNVTKQGKEQDSTGKFIRKYVPELANVPDQFIHEPWKMSKSIQLKNRIVVGRQSEVGHTNKVDDGVASYPAPIVDEQESARVAKRKMSAVRKEQSTRDLAKNVYVKHGSRSRNSSEMNGRKSMVEEIEGTKQGKQLRIKDLFSGCRKESADISRRNKNRPRPADNEHFGSAAKRMKEPLLKPNKGWACSACTYWNDNPHRLICAMCSTKKGFTVKEDV